MRGTCPYGVLLTTLALLVSPPKIRTIRGPGGGNLAQRPPLWLVSLVRRLYRQQTKNFLVSYSPKKIGFF